MLVLYLCLFIAHNKTTWHAKQSMNILQACLLLLPCARSDLVLEYPVAQTLSQFNQLQAAQGGNASSNASALLQFVNTTLAPTGR